jgi:rod shape-determining protein MreD
VISVVRTAALILLAAVVQLAIVSDIELLGGIPDLMLVVTIAIAFTRGSLFAATAGFLGGCLIDAGALETTIGVTSLLYCLAGYGAGRYAETTGRGRSYAPYLTMFVLGTLVGVGGYLLHYLLGDAGSGSVALGPVIPSAALDVVLLVLAFRLTRRLGGGAAPALRASDLEVTA